MKKNLEQPTVWKVIKRLRFEYLKTADIDVYCFGIASDSLDSNLEKIATLLQISNVSTFIDNDLSEEEIHVGAKMFFTLFSCPSFYDRLYKRALYGSTSRIALLSLNIIKKSPQAFKPVAKKIFGKIITILRSQNNSEKNFEFMSSKDIRNSLTPMKGRI